MINLDTMYLIWILFLTLFLVLKMNFSTNSLHGSPACKENVAPSAKTDSFQHPRSKQRTVLGALSENDQRGRSLSQAGHSGKVKRYKAYWFFNYFFIYYSWVTTVSSSGKPVFQAEFHFRQLPAEPPGLCVQFQLRCVRRRGLWGRSCSFGSRSCFRRLWARRWS